MLTNQLWQVRYARQGDESAQVQGPLFPTTLCGVKVAFKTELSDQPVTTAMPTLGTAPTAPTYLVVVEVPQLLRFVGAVGLDFTTLFTQVCLALVARTISGTFAFLLQS